MVDEKEPFSKTELPCECGALERAADDPFNPVEFDQRLRCRSTITVSTPCPRRDYVVPLAVKGRGLEVDGLEFTLGDLDAGRVGALVEPGLDSQTSPRRSVRDEVDDDFVSDQGSAAPVAGDVAKHPVLDLVPLACAWREVAHREADAGLICEVLQGHLPSPRPRTVTAATVGVDHQLGGVWVTA